MVLEKRSWPHHPRLKTIFNNGLLHRLHKEVDELYTNTVGKRQNMNRVSMDFESKVHTSNSDHNAGNQSAFGYIPDTQEQRLAYRSADFYTVDARASPVSQHDR